MPIYVINLDRSADRLARITRELAAAGLDFRRLAAVDAAALPRSSGYDAAANAIGYLAPLSTTEIACVLSHRDAWRRLVEEAAPAAVILEDDARPVGVPADLARLLGHIASSPRPELVKLYNLRPLVPRATAAWRLHEPLLPALTTTAQALNRSAAVSLLRFTETFHEPADVIIQRWWNHGVRVTALDPPAFEEVGHDSDSTIRRRGAAPPEGRLRRELRRPLFQARRFARALVARWCACLSGRSNQ
jgi:glycosyl transferase family 25